MSKILTIDCGGSKCALTIWQSSCSALPQELAAAAFAAAMPWAED